MSGLKAALALAEAGADAGPALPPERLYDAVNIILSYQNHDGGWATYENTRSFHALEVCHSTSGVTADSNTIAVLKFYFSMQACQLAGLQVLNPAETFGDIIVDYSYVECSSACITGLAAFAARYPGQATISAHSHFHAVTSTSPSSSHSYSKVAAGHSAHGASTPKSVAFQHSE